ncbi:hypothetical protein SALBM135S_04892 [Streptomyces alboniger]
MKRAVPKGDDRPGESYGLGLQPLTLSCSAVVWGNGGDIHGSSTAAMTTEDGRHSLAVNVNAPSDELPAVIDAEFCGKRWGRAPAGGAYRGCLPGVPIGGAPRRTPPGHGRATPSGRCVRRRPAGRGRP